LEKLNKNSSIVTVDPFLATDTKQTNGTQQRAFLSLPKGMRGRLFSFSQFASTYVMLFAVLLHDG
jgi:hypothetical protein